MVPIHCFVQYSVACICDGTMVSHLFKTNAVFIPDDIVKTATFGVTFTQISFRSPDKQKGMYLNFCFYYSMVKQFCFYEVEICNGTMVSYFFKIGCSNSGMVLGYFLIWSRPIPELKKEVSSKT